ncbi:HEAT repeat domain-containing protein [Tengunoibacter tsumagoiensis]|uniref:Peptidase C14 caspase domain-containing protein n=1 Tax=Tengunoibacter tsumagoiensis TaxID=2014871 RepID=A0A402A5X0_9CHLR|nr:HEAT repeat domain-containing protein [Tengunoibacter tsumagoiensis]GCE14543.1 hypothetical protein KTT_44020 [Tengunoibacter tsumagoiensis]
MTEPKRYACLLGANGPQSMRLQYAERDVERLASALQHPRCSFQVAPLIAESRQKSLVHLRNTTEKCQPQDTLVVHFSGHAIFDEELFLICNETDPDDLLSSGLEISDIKKLIRKCKARNKVLILDCCHAAGAHPNLFKGVQDFRGELNQALQGSANVILSACSRRAQAREVEALEAGFLSWAVSAACQEHFQDASPDQHSLSLADIWSWVNTARDQMNQTYSIQLPLPVFIQEQEGFYNDIWFSLQQRTGSMTRQYISANLRRKYLEHLCKYYSTVTLPIGPAEGFSLHAIFQPLELRSEPLAAEDLDKRMRRPLLGEPERALDDVQSQFEASENKRSQPTRVIAENSEDALKKSPHHRVVILGGPGTGKTTTLKYLIGRHAQEALLDHHLPIPIFLSLPDFVRFDRPLRHYLADMIERFGIDAQFAELVWQELDNGHAFVCLDSLDEVRPEARPGLIAQINTWALENKSTWIVGSRFTEYKGGQFKRGQFAEWEILSLNHERRLALAHALLPELQQRLEITPSPILTPPSFIDLLEHHPQAAAWGENPLLLSLAAIVFLKTRGLPASRTMLYKEVVEALIKTREASSVWSTLLWRLLTALALWLHQNKGRIFSINDLLTFLINVQGKSDQEAATFAERIIASGIIEPVAKEIYGFRHQTFQEYLAAVELANGLVSREEKTRERIRQLIWSKRRYSRWTEILRLMVGALAHYHGSSGWQEAFIWLQSLLDQKDTSEGDIGNVGLLLIISSLVELRDAPQKPQPALTDFEKKAVLQWETQLFAASTGNNQQQRLLHIIREIQLLSNETTLFTINQFLKSAQHFSGQRRKIAIEAFGLLRSSESIKVFQQALHDEDDNVRFVAAEALGQVGEFEFLIEALHDEDNFVRHIAAHALGQTGERMPIEALLLALHDDDGFVRQAAAAALGQAGERMPIEALLLALHDENSSVRRAAAEALGQAGERMPIEALLLALHDDDRSVRRAAAEALGQAGERMPIEALLLALHDENRFVRSAAAQSLGQAGERMPIEALLLALHDEESDVRRAASEALGQAGERIPIEALLLALHDEESDVRRAAARALGQAGDEMPIEALLLALHDKNGSVRQAAAEVLGQAWERMPVEALLFAVYDKDRPVRSVAAEALGHAEERMPIEALLLALHDEDGDVRRAAAEALGQVGERMPIEALVLALHDKERDVRRAAALALGQAGERMPIEALLVALHDKASNVRSAAAKALGQAGERIPIEALLLALQDKHGNVRSTAAEALGHAGEKMPIEALLLTLHDDDFDVHSAAAEALGQAGEKMPIEALLLTLHDKNRSVCSAAAEALGHTRERMPVEALMIALHDGESHVRSAAAEVLGQAGERMPVEALLQALHDEDGSVRSAAAEALGQAEEWMPVEALLQTLHDRDSYVRRAATYALGRAGERMPIEALLQTLHDKNSFVRSGAVAALGQAGDRMPIEVLLQTLHDDDNSVRSTVIEVLGQAGKRVPAEVFLHALYDEDRFIRHAAVAQLLKIDTNIITREEMLLLITDEDASVRSTALKLLKKQYGHEFEMVLEEATAILEKRASPLVFKPLAQTIVADILSDMKVATPLVFETLEGMLVSPSWQVRVHAIRALENIRRSIPNTIISRLIALCSDPDPRMRVVRRAADAALAEILSLEASIEDDEV